MAASRYELRALVESGVGVGGGDNHLLSQAQVASPCATLVASCFPDDLPFDLGF